MSSYSISLGYGGSWGCTTPDYTLRPTPIESPDVELHHSLCPQLPFSDLDDYDLEELLDLWPEDDWRHYEDWDLSDEQLHRPIIDWQSIMEEEANQPSSPTPQHVLPHPVLPRSGLQYDDDDDDNETSSAASYESENAAPAPTPKRQPTYLPRGLDTAAAALLAELRACAHPTEAMARMESLTAVIAAIVPEQREDETAVRRAHGANFWLGMVLANRAAALGEREQRVAAKERRLAERWEKLEVAEQAVERREVLVDISEEFAELHYSGGSNFQAMLDQHYGA